MKELDARYAKRVRTATAELIVYAKSIIKFIREYSDAMAKIGTVAMVTYASNSFIPPVRILILRKLFGSRVGRAVA